MRRRLTPLALALLAGAGCAERVLDETPPHARLLLDLRALQATHPATSVLDRVSLSWGAADSLVQTYAGRDTVPFTVTVPRAGATFTASVWSNNGTRLYGAVAQYTPAASGFRTILDVSALDAVMIVTPDTIDLRANSSPDIIIRNAGSQPLVWTAQPPCVVESCIRLRRNAGTVAAGRADTVGVSGHVSLNRSATLRIDSNVGFVTLTARGDAVVIPAQATNAGS